jgi:hypothetical protein
MTLISWNKGDSHRMFRVRSEYSCSGLHDICFSIYMKEMKEVTRGLDALLSMTCVSVRIYSVMTSVLLRPVPP